MNIQACVASSSLGRKPRTLCRGVRWISLLAVALLAFPALAQDRVCSLSKASGDVKITRSTDGSVETPTQVGSRVRGGSVFAGDVIATGAGATATVLFGDGTLVDMAESTSISVKETDLSALVAAGQRDRPIGRTIKILAGDIFSEVAKNPSVATEFETPSGVAAVKGTKLSISVGRSE